LSNVAEELAGWVIALEPTAEDLELAQRALVDMVASLWPVVTIRSPTSRA